VFPIENNVETVANRTRIEILASILKVAQKGALKTHIMYKANLSHKQLTKYLQFVIGNALLQEISDPEDGTRLYQVTEKGIQFLKDYERLSIYME
jgi:predicted transcriptional regulator